MDSDEEYESPSGIRPYPERGPTFESPASTYSIGGSRYIGVDVLTSGMQAQTSSSPFSPSMTFGGEYDNKSESRASSGNGVASTMKTPVRPSSGTNLRHTRGSTAMPSGTLQHSDGVSSATDAILANARAVMHGSVPLETIEASAAALQALADKSQLFTPESQFRSPDQRQFASPSSNLSSVTSTLNFPSPNFTQTTRSGHMFASPLENTNRLSSPRNVPSTTPKSTANVRKSPLPTALPVLSPTSASKWTRPVLSQPTTSNSEVQRLQTQLNAKNSEITVLGDTISQLEVYAGLVERRLLEISPDHPLPVTNAMLGTSIDSLSKLATSAAQTLLSHVSPSKVSGQTHVVSAAAAARREAREAAETIRSLERALEKCRTEGVEATNRVKEMRTQLDHKERERMAALRRAEGLMQKVVSLQAELKQAGITPSTALDNLYSPPPNAPFYSVTSEAAPSTSRRDSLSIPKGKSTSDEGMAEREWDEKVIADVETYKEKFEHQKKLAQDLRKQIHILERALEMKNGESGDEIHGESSRGALLTEIARLRGDIEGRKQQEERQSKEILDLEKKLRSSQEQMHELQQELEQLRTLEAKTDSVGTLSAKVSEEHFSPQAIAAITRLREESVSLLKSLEADKKRLEGEKEALSEYIGEMATSNNSLKEQVQSLLSEKLVLESRIKKQEYDVQARRESGVAPSPVPTPSSPGAAKTSRATARTPGGKDSDNEKEVLRADLEELQEVQMELVEEIKALNRKLRATERERNSLRQSLQRSKSNLTSSEDQSATLEDERLQVELEAEELRTKAQRLQKEADRYKRQAETLRQSLVSSQGKIEEIESNNATLLAQIHDAERRLTELSNAQQEGMTREEIEAHRNQLLSAAEAESAKFLRTYRTLHLDTEPEAPPEGDSEDISALAAVQAAAQAGRKASERAAAALSWATHPSVAGSLPSFAQCGRLFAGWLRLAGTSLSDLANRVADELAEKRSQRRTVHEELRRLREALQEAREEWSYEKDRAQELESRVSRLSKDRDSDATRLALQVQTLEEERNALRERVDVLLQGSIDGGLSQGKLESQVEAMRQQVQELSKNKEDLLKRVHSLQSANNTLSEMKASMSTEIRLANESLEEARALSGVLRMERDSLMSRISELEKQLLVLSQSIRETKEAQESAMAAHSMSEKEKQRLQEEYNELRRVKEELNAQVKSLEEIITGSEDTINRQNEMIHRLQENLQTAGEERVALQRSLSGVSNELETSRTLLESLSNEADSRMDSLFTTLRRLGIDTSNAEALLAAPKAASYKLESRDKASDPMSGLLGASIDVTLSQYSPLHSVYQKLRALLSGAVSVGHSCSHKVNSMLGEIGNLKVDVASTKSRLETVQELQAVTLEKSRGLAEAEVTISELRSELISTRSKLAAVQAEVTSVRSLLNEKEQEIENSATRICTLIKEAEVNRDAQMRLKDTLLEKEKEIRELQGEIEDLKRDSDNLLVHRSRVEALAQRDNLRLSELNAQVVTLNAQKQRLESQITRLSEDAASARKEATESRVQHMAVLSQKEELLAQLDQKENELIALRGHLKALSGQQSQLQQSVTRDINTLTTEASVAQASRLVLAQELAVKQAEIDAARAELVALKQSLETHRVYQKHGVPEARLASVATTAAPTTTITSAAVTAPQRPRSSLLHTISPPQDSVLSPIPPVHSGIDSLGDTATRRLSERRGSLHSDSTLSTPSTSTSGENAPPSTSSSASTPTRHSIASRSSHSRILNLESPIPSFPPLHSNNNNLGYSPSVDSTLNSPATLALAERMRIAKEKFNALKEKGLVGIEGGSS